MRQHIHAVAGETVIITPQQEARFWAKVVKTESCWIWTGAKTPYGHGNLNTGQPGHSRVAHRFGYEFMVGQVPDGLELDHLCRNPPCVRPEHLEPVTHLENVRRGESGQWQAAKTHCPKGHEYTPENTDLRKHSRGGPNRVCVSCRRINGREAQRRLRRRRCEKPSL